jgi:hypothetical protein
MSRRSRKPDHRSAGPPPLVLALLSVEVMAVIVLLLVGVALSDVALAVAPVTAVTMAFLNPTVQELGRRQAKLSVVADQDTGERVVPAPALCRWPLDIDRVVANELAAARETMALHGRFADMPLGLGSLVSRPSEAEHARVREAFEQELPDFDVSLRAWLAEYSIAAVRHSRTFDLTLRLNNSSGAHAEGVRVVLDLPATVRVIDERPVVALPPGHPVYEPPRSRFPGAGWMDIPTISPVARGNVPATIPKISLSEPPWRIDGNCMEASLDEVHAGRSVGVGEPLLLLADGEGQHEVGWTVYTKSARRPARGTFWLMVPPDTDRPAFGRLHGITSYPDAPLVDDDGEVVHHVRATDPPPRPPAGQEGGDLKARLRQVAPLMEWHALGLDPAADSAHGALPERDTP